MILPRSKSDLSPARQALIDMISDLGYGRIDRVALQCGEPRITPETMILRSAKFGGPTDVRGARTCAQELKKHLLQLMSFFDGLQDAESIEIIVHDGLPIRAVANVTGTIGRRRGVDPATDGK